MNFGVFPEGGVSDRALLWAAPWKNKKREFKSPFWCVTGRGGTFFALLRLASVRPVSRGQRQAHLLSHRLSVFRRPHPWQCARPHVEPALYVTCDEALDPKASWHTLHRQTPCKNVRSDAAAFKSSAFFCTKRRRTQTNLRRDNGDNDGCVKARRNRLQLRMFRTRLAALVAGQGACLLAVFSIALPALEMSSPAPAIV